MDDALTSDGYPDGLFSPFRFLLKDRALIYQASPTGGSWTGLSIFRVVPLRSRACFKGASCFSKLRQRAMDSNHRHADQMAATHHCSVEFFSPPLP